MKKFLCAVLFVLVLAGLSYAAEDAGTVSLRDLAAQAKNSLKFERLYEDKYVTVTGCEVQNIEADGNDYVLRAWEGTNLFLIFFRFTAANAEQIADLDKGDVVTIRGLVRGSHNDKWVTLYNCEIIK
ncbi:MAG: hypothetical protein IJ576_07260 [Synergistaceae bacterium]|nr:hypothetical protein [Synergistaceae bacterium]